jgi:hypothetical protein
MRPEGLREHWPILTGHRRAVSVSGWEPAPSVIQGASALAKDLPVSSRLERPPNFVACPSRGDSAKVGNGHVSVVGWRKFHVCCKHRLAVRAIVERLVKLPKYGCADLLMIEAGRRDHGNRLSVDQPSKKPIRRLAFCLILLARPERFERPTPWFVAKYSIQLSYGRLAVFEAEIIPSWFAPLKHYLDQPSGRWRCRGLASGLCAAGAGRDVPCRARPGLARRSQARLTTGRR